MKKNLLLEGAVAGHMNHIYDNGEMAFGELKQLIEFAAAGKLKGTEKTDGQNIFLSFDVNTGTAKAARNKGHLKIGGLDASELDSFFSEHPNQALRYSFVEAVEAFEDTVKQLSEEAQRKIFGPFEDIGQDQEKFKPPFYAFYNVEVMNPSTTNVISYDKKTLLVHRVGHSIFELETGQKVTDESKIPIPTREQFDILESNLMNIDNTTREGEFSVETNQIRNLAPIKDRKIFTQTLSKLDSLMSDNQLGDENTINEMVINQVTPEIDQLGLLDRNKRLVLMRVMGIKDPETGKTPSITTIVRGMPSEIKEEVSSYIKNFKYTNYTKNLEHILHDFSMAMVDGLESSFINDNKKEIENLRRQLTDTLSKVKSSNNVAAIDEIERQMAKLKNASNINTPSEGFVFDFNGVTYKFTGWFAPSNQILGMIKFNRFGLKDSAEGTQGDELEQTQATTKTIAVVPGAFKPPHKGHLSMVMSLSKVAEKVIIIISKPTVRGRTLPSGKPKTSDHAAQIWSAFLDKTGLRDRVSIIQSPAASPVGVT